MKRLRFESLELLSLRERKARNLEFHHRITVITGTNDVGKSSVIKSLYWAFGATPAVIHPTWANANVKALVTFTVDGTRYKILRDHTSIAVFDEHDRLLLTTSQITKDLAPFLASLLNFKLVLTNRQGEPEVPPPAYAFLPFYIDQDSGWTKPLDSFSYLTQYTDFRKALLEFHTGILPNEYYELEAEKRRLQVDQRLLEADRRVIQKAVERFKLEVNFDGLELSIEGHEQAIEQLLERIQSVRTLRQVRAKELADVLDERLLIEQQLLIVKASIFELEKDATFAGELPDEVFCPTCGTNHQNDFANRFGIVEDREACFEFFSRARSRVAELTAKAVRAEAELRSADRTISEIQTAINVKKGDISLFEVIESRGRRIASNMFDGQIDQLNRQIGEILGIIKDITTNLENLKDKSRRNKIVRFYSEFMLKYLDRLDVTNFSGDEVMRIPARIRETGSDLPRAILSYFLAVLQTISQFSSSIFSPIVVDSPNQQDQDDTNVAKMIDLILSEHPPQAQVILGSVSLHGRVVRDGKIIDLTEKKSVLRASEFESVSASLRPLLNKMLA
ncbi:hypothetical protein [Sphingomonas sp. IC-56]|uniref:hypothetical protein n=1 Tax=Sphingomonas sp. IC-56 TaxID=2898529 RepID=UPI001E4048F0|nr:hypothetical protein [Sphingomonas sp. IC-56]